MDGFQVLKKALTPRSLAAIGAGRGQSPKQSHDQVPVKDKRKCKD